MLSPETVDAIRREVTQGFDDQLAFTTALIRQPSPMGEESAAQDLVEAEMRRLGLEIDRFPLELERLEGQHGFSPPIIDYAGLENVVGVHRPSTSVAGAAPSRGRSLILNAHIDVVPEGPRHRWTEDPFSGIVKDGWLYGRGAADMKAGLAAMLAAYGAVRRAGLSPSAPVILQSVVEEEATGNGTLACVERGYRADFAIIPEASSLTAVDAQVGLMWFDIFIEGEPRHPSLAATGGTNAIEKATYLMAALKELEDEWNAEKGEHPEFAQMPRPIVIYVGKISGGDWVSSVPAWCRLEVRVGFYPDMERSDVIEQLSGKIRRWAERDEFLSLFPPRVTAKGQYGEGYVMSEQGDQGLAVLADHHQSVNRQDLLRVTSGGSSDARILGIDGQTPTVLYGPIGRGYHGYDEAVEVESIRKMTEALALFLADWCGAV